MKWTPTELELIDLAVVEMRTKGLTYYRACLRLRKLLRDRTFEAIRGQLKRKMK